MSEEERLSRRKFSGLAALGGIAAAIAGLLGIRKLLHADRSVSMVIPGATSLPPGASLVFQYPTPEAPCLLIRTQGGRYVAYSRICTHAGCPVFFHPESNDIECPCHGGSFSVEDGRVLTGPPPRPLPRIRLEVREREIMARGVIRS
jgi:Rieske Fe-S protein